MSNAELDKLYRRVCRKQPAPSAMQAFRDRPEREAVVDFLVAKLSAYLSVSRSSENWKMEIEWGAINACRLLGEFKAAVAIAPMIEILDDVKDDYELYIYSAVLIALEGMGPETVEPAYQRYERDRTDRERGGVWLNVLALAGAKDERIPPALVEFMKADPAQAVALMGDYGDQALLPIVEEFVLTAVHAINADRIDPLAFGARLNDPRVHDYIEGRESLVLLREGTSHADPSIRAKVEALDRELLQYSDFAPYDPSRPAPETSFASAMGEKLGRNDPCPCGSGKKYKRCCEEL